MSAKTVTAARQKLVVLLVAALGVCLRSRSCLMEPCTRFSPFICQVFHAEPLRTSAKRGFVCQVSHAEPLRTSAKRGFICQVFHAEPPGTSAKRGLMSHVLHVEPFQTSANRVLVCRGNVREGSTHRRSAFTVSRLVATNRAARDKQHKGGRSKGRYAAATRAGGL